MKTAVAHTSINAFHHAAPTFSAQQRVIMKQFATASAFTRKVYTRKELARDTGMEISAVAARTNELVRKQCLIECGTTRCTVSGHTVGALCLPLTILS